MFRLLFFRYLPNRTSIWYLNYFFLVIKCLIKQAFDIDLFYHLYWNDDRLRGIDNIPENITLGSEWKKHLWIPDTYFRNAISGGVANDMMSPSHYFIIRNRTNVFMAARLRMKLNCDMDFTEYPFDRQLCYMNITTRKYS